MNFHFVVSFTGRNSAGAATHNSLHSCIHSCLSPFSWYFFLLLYLALAERDDVGFRYPPYRALSCFSDWGNGHRWLQHQMYLNHWKKIWDVGYNLMLRSGSKLLLFCVFIDSSNNLSYSRSHSEVFWLPLTFSFTLLQTNSTFIKGWFPLNSH